MIEVDRPADLAAHVGQYLGEGEWLTIDQSMIDAFAEATGDHQWIHVDTERAKREMPGGRTIAHGFLTLSLVPRLSRGIYSGRQRSRGLNYGCNKVRFTAPVPCGSRIRVRLTLKAYEPLEGGARLTVENVVIVEGQEKPAMIAETIVALYD